MLASSAGIAAWTGLLALRRSAAPEPGSTPIAPIVAPARPERLPTAPEFERLAVAAATTREHTATIVLVRVPAVPPALRGTAAGIATFDARSGADFTWVPLSEAAVADDGSIIVQCATHVRGDLQVSFATAPQWARHGYLARTTLTVGTARDGRITLDLPVAVDTVRLSLPAGATRAGPLRLARRDDPQWLPTAHSAIGIEVRLDRPTEVLLGAGSYELVDPIDANRRQPFDVPSANPVTLMPALTAVRADRP